MSPPVHSLLLATSSIYGTFSLFPLCSISPILTYTPSLLACKYSFLKSHIKKKSSFNSTYTIESFLLTPSLHRKTSWKSCLYSLTSHLFFIPPSNVASAHPLTPRILSCSITKDITWPKPWTFLRLDPPCFYSFASFDLFVLLEGI